MYKSLFLGACVCVLVTILGAAVQAAQIPLTNTLQQAVWPGLDDDNLLSIDEDDPVTTLTTIPMVGQTVAPPSSFSVAENNFQAAGPPPIAGQSFLATKSGTVGNVQMLISGGPATYDVHLYDVGAGAPAPTGGTSYLPTLPDLMPADSWIRFFGTASTSVYLVDFVGAGLTNIPIIKGHTYIWELVGLERDANGVLTGNPSPNNAMTWNRNAPSAAIGGSYLPNGQAFRSRSSLNGNPDRSFAMAVTIIPEPATLALVGLGLVAFAVVGRRRVQ